MSMPSDATAAAAQGRLSDGKSAASMDVAVRLAATGIEILPRGGSQPQLWPYAALATAEPLTAHAIDALVTCADRPGATLFVADVPFARQLATRAPHLSARALRWRHARPLVWATAAAAVAGALVWVLDLSPARAIANMLPDQARATLGRQVVQSMTEGRRLCEAPQGRSALDRLTKRLSQAAGGGADFNVVVADWGLLNAFAAPGEQIVLTRGLIDKAEGPDEVAGVLAHEMGHGLERHPETGIVRAIGLSAATDLMLGGSGGTLANIGLILAQLSYTRDAEREADERGLAVLAAAGVSAQGLADFFHRVEKLEGGSIAGKALSEITVLRTHPVTAERIQLVESQPAYPATPSLSDDDWKALKYICATQKSGPEETL